MKKKISAKKLFVFFIVTMILFMGTVLFYLFNLNREFYFEKKQYNLTVDVNKNTTIRSILNQLDANNVKAMRYLIKYKKIDSKIKAGVYYINGNYTLNEIFLKLVKGDYEKVKVLIPEGFTLKQIKERLAALGLVNEEKFDEILAAKKDFYYLPPNGNYEGFFFPDTYFFTKRDGEEEIINRMLKRFIEKYPVEKYRDKNDFYQKLILASIIEKEGYHQDEKPLIASVFLNRIAKNMRLQSCATVEYLFDYKKQRLLDKDLWIESPYNTYRNKGLPPGPISNPGEKSIEAAMNPAKTNYLYFVAGDDHRHTFSEEYKDHLKAKADLYSE